MCLKDFADDPQIKIQISDACKIGLKLVKQVRELHRLGMVHGDIQPSNVLFGHHHQLIRKLLNLRKNQPHLANRIISFEMQREIIKQIGSLM